MTLSLLSKIGHWWRPGSGWERCGPSLLILRSRARSPRSSIRTTLLANVEQSSSHGCGLFSCSYDPNPSPGTDRNPEEPPLQTSATDIFASKLIRSSMHDPPTIRSRVDSLTGQRTRHRSKHRRPDGANRSDMLENDKFLPIDPNPEARNRPRPPSIHRPQSKHGNIHAP